MPLTLDKTDIKGQEESAFVDAEKVYHKETIAVPTPERNIGVDTKETIYTNIINAGQSHQLDVNALESFTSISQSRNSVYNLMDSMSEDSTISAVLETYAEDATEYNDQGQIVWAESSKAHVQKFVQFLLDSMNVDKNIYKWMYSLCKYGDCYLRLYRESDWRDDLLFNEEDKKKKVLTEELEETFASINMRKNKLDEAIKVKAYSKNDHYVNYMELEPNPADIFELTKFGKTYAYIIAPASNANNNFQNGFGSEYQLQGQMSYRFNKSDVTVHGPTDFVHACLEDNSSRTPELVQIFNGNEDSKGLTYKVKRGQSLLYNTFKTWRELQLLENSVLLNRVTKSSIVRMISVEVGDMPKEMVGPHLQGIKALIEQKSAINTGKSISEYTNPGPIENNIYIPTHEGVGAITASQIGGDVDVKSLADLEYYEDKLFGSFRVPKQYFGRTGDSAGFDAGKSLSIISSRYGKMVKRIQNTMIQALTDAINLMLLDRGLITYVNEFQIRMLAPTTQEELDRRENVQGKVSLTQDVMNMLDGIEDPIAKLKILKSLLSNILTNGEVIAVIQDQIDKLESEAEEAAADEAADTDLIDNEMLDTDMESSSSLDSGSDSFDLSSNDSLGGEDSLQLDSDSFDLGSEETIEPIDNQSLPNGEDLGIDLTQNI